MSTLLPTDNLDLRRALDLEGTFIHEHRRKLAELAKTHPHTIAFVGDARASSCVAEALGLWQFPGYDAIRHRYRDLFAGRAFMNYLLGARATADKGLLRSLGPRDVEPGDLVLYMQRNEPAGDRRWKHIGVACDGGRVRSQWGEFPLYEHQLDEVPAQYGDFVVYMEPLDPQRAYEAFLGYAHVQGLAEKTILEITGRAMH